MPASRKMIFLAVIVVRDSTIAFSAMAHARVMPPISARERSHGTGDASHAESAPCVMGAALGIGTLRPSVLPKVPVDPDSIGNIWDRMRAAAPKRRPQAVTKDAWMGKWTQESINTDGLDASLKAEGTPWLIRKMIKSIERKLDIEVDANGYVVLKTTVPTQGTVEFRVQETKELADRSPVSFSVMGVDMAIRTYWEGKAVVQTTVKSSKGSSVTARVVYQLDESVAGHPRLRATEESEKGASYGWVLGLV